MPYIINLYVGTFTKYIYINHALTALLRDLKPG